MARVLALTTPLERGPDVKRFQQALNARLAARSLPTIGEDGAYGPATEAAAARVKFLLGWDANNLHHAVGSQAQQWIEQPDRRPQLYKRRSAHRLDQLLKASRAQAAGHSAVDRGIGYARKYIGTHEAGDSNWGGMVATWLTAVQCGPAPWCGAFAHACLVAAGVKGLSWRMRYVPYIVEDAAAGHNGLLKLIAFDQARPGDLICFDWDGDGVMDHVGLYLGDGVTIEGNTSRDPNAPPDLQSNGGEVCVRRRGIGSAALWGHVARPRYPAR